MGLVDKWRYRLLTRKVPAIIIHDAQNIEVSDGLIKKSNHLEDPWNNTGYEIHSGPIQIINKGTSQAGFIVSSFGITVPLIEDITVLKSVPAGGSDHPAEVIGNVKIRWSGVVGVLTSADVIEKGMDLVGSNKKLLIGIVVGIFLGWFVVGPIVSKILS